MPLRLRLGTLLLLVTPAALGFRLAQHAAEITNKRATKITIGAVGDVLLHESLQVQASQEQLKHRHLWQATSRLMKVVDVMYANLEGPTAYGVGIAGNPKTKADAIAVGGRGCELVDDARDGPYFDGRIYTGFPRFNFDERLAKDLSTDGVDVVSTANNHVMDRCYRGINRTIEALKGAGMKWTGTRRKMNLPWHATTKSKGITVAWLGCTSAGSAAQKQWTKNSFVLNCDDTDLIKRMVKELKRSNDAVIVTPHWGKEYGERPEDFQTKQARTWLDAGAVVVIGNHAHITQKAEKYTTTDGRTTLIAYSLGNFVSHQGWRTVGVTRDGELAKRVSPFILVGLSKSCSGRNCRTVLDAWRFVPLFVWRQDAETCSGCKCPKPLGQKILKHKQRCHKFRVMAADKSASSTANKAFRLVQSKMRYTGMKYSDAVKWVEARGRAPKPAPGVGEPCRGTPGKCIDISKSSCPRKTKTGLCPGGNSIRCCPFDTRSYGAGASCRGVTGTCIDTNKDSCPKQTLTNKCLGAASIRCCPIR